MAQELFQTGADIGFFGAQGFQIGGQLAVGFHSVGGFEARHIALIAQTGDQRDGALNDPLSRTVEDDSVEGEQRFVTIGTDVFGSLMVVVHPPRSRGSRPVSVRKPDLKEWRNYEKGV